MKVDLHVHASERSGCSQAGEEEQIQAAINHGLDALAFTDHDRLVPAERLEELNVQYAPFRVFGGIEISTLEDEHVVVLGVHDPDLESREWHYEDLHRLTHERGGYLFLAHPYRYREGVNINVQNYPPDAIEMRSVNTGEDKEGIIQALIDRIGCATVWNSDAHSTDCVGLFHVVLDAHPVNDTELLAALRSGRYVRGKKDDPS